MSNSIQQPGITYVIQYRSTGSTFSSAIGLDTLKKQKLHHNVHVNKKPSPPVPPELQEMFDHGKAFEVHGLATLVGILMPLLLPPCYAYFEISTKLFDSPRRKGISCVSPNGMLECSDGADCTYRDTFHHRCIMIEIKSPFPNPDLPEDPYYAIPG